MENMVDLNFFKNKRVFITGHTGFKGSWLSYILDRNKLKDLKESMEIKIMTSEEDWNNLEIKLNEQIKSFNDKKISLLEIKNSLSKSLDKNVLNLYENFLSKSRSLGIAKLENNISSCCKMELPNAFIEKIKSTTAPIVCNCGKSLISE